MMGHFYLFLTTSLNYLPAIRQLKNLVNITEKTLLNILFFFLLNYLMIRNLI